MIRIANATFDDLAYIGSWLCAEDRRELAVTRNPDDYPKLARDAYASKIHKVALDHAGTPVFAFGANRLGTTDAALVWGFKCERGWPAILTVTKYIRRTMIPELRALGVRRALCIVHPANQRSQKWLTHNLGFRPKATLTGIGSRREEMILMQRDEPDARPN
jgi:hypothetical protein